MRRAVVAVVVLALASCGGPPPPPPPSAAPIPAPQSADANPSRDGSPWDDARSRGVEFRAIGQEPGWYLEIDNERWMRLFYAYAEKTATTPVPAPLPAGQPVTLESSADGHSLKVEIALRDCADAMSGEPFPASVTVTIDGTVLQGCGRWLQP